MKIRCDLHINNEASKLILMPRPEEKFDHLGLKLAATAMFSSRHPIVAPSADHAALSQVDLRPDVMVLNAYGHMDLWVECGTTTVNKLDKVARRFPEARIVVLKENERDAKQLRATLDQETRHSSRIEIWYWGASEFDAWLRSLEERVVLIGEAHEKFLNLVVNETPYTAQLLEL